MSAISQQEIDFCRAVADMLARPDFLLPLAAAERQFRDHYYGLNSAALLEDLFFDALGNFLRQTSPMKRLSRPNPGQKGWDYEFEGLRFSHKVSRELGDIAALWDATKSGVTTWSFDHPIVYVLGMHSPATRLLANPNGHSFGCRPISRLSRPERLGNKTALLIDWPTGSSQPVLLDAKSPGGTDLLPVALEFTEVWSTLADFISGGRPANEFDVLVTNATLSATVRKSIASSIGQPLDLSLQHRAGIYVLSRALLQNLAVRTNNRAILIPETVVATLLPQAQAVGLFVPIALWYQAYAQVRPPDLYSAQRAEYDALFSARGITLPYRP